MTPLKQSVLVSWGAAIRARREELGLSQEMLADACQVAYATVNRWELGNQEPDLDAKFELADVLGVEPADLFPMVQP